MVYIQAAGSCYDESVMCKWFIFKLQEVVMTRVMLAESLRLQGDVQTQPSIRESAGVSSHVVFVVCFILCFLVMKDYSYLCYGSNIKSTN